jgi:hypothetical protein
VVQALPVFDLDHFVDRGAGQLLVEIEGRLTRVELSRLLILSNFDSISTAISLPHQGNAVAVFQVRFQVEEEHRGRQ